MRQQLSARDYRMAKTICTVCMGYLVCNMPIMIYRHTIGKNAKGSPYLKLIFATLYWVQCSVNFIIYAASNKQYREAYFMFLRVAVFKLDDDPYISTTTSNRGTNRCKTTERQSQSSGNRPAKIRANRVRFAKRHPISLINLSQKSEPCPGKASKKTKSIDDKNDCLLLSEIPSNPVTQKEFQVRQPHFFPLLDKDTPSSSSHSNCPPPHELKLSTCADIHDKPGIPHDEQAKNSTDRDQSHLDEEDGLHGNLVHTVSASGTLQNMKFWRDGRSSRGPGCGTRRACSYPIVTMDADTLTVRY